MSRFMSLLRLTTVLLASLLPGVLRADEVRTSRLVILCGHPGDAEFRAAFVETVDTLVTGLTTR
mgnify:CR=1 FL=1